MLAVETASMSFPKWFISSPGRYSQLLFATCLKTQILAEERHYMVLKTIGDLARVRAGIDFKAVRNPVLVENIVQLFRVDA